MKDPTKSAPSHRDFAGTPQDRALSRHLLEEIRALPGRYPQPRSAVMPALDLAQEELGYLTPEVMSEVAGALQLDPGYVEGVATFYTLFHLEPIGRHRFYVCTNLSCTLRGAEAIVEHLQGAIGVKAAGEVSKDGLFSYEEVECLGACEYAPMCRLDHRYQFDLTPEKIDVLVAERRAPATPAPAPHPGRRSHRLRPLTPALPPPGGGRSHLLPRPNPLELRARGRLRRVAEQRGTVGGPVLTEWFATPDLHKLDVYESLGGYSALRKVVTTMTAVQVIDEVKMSGLRGRGGADFPTATKWSFVPKDHPGPKYIVVNADESEPGSAKDRYLLENSPHALVEGAAIAAFAIGGHQAWVYIRGEYDVPYEMLSEAIAEAHAKGYLGDHPFGFDYPLDIRLYRGHGAYICGEETALLESLEGKRAQPRSRPPFPALKGAWGMPTAVNNVETLSTVPWIMRHGGAEYAKRGTEKAKGTRIVTVSGDVQKPGNYEIEIGVTYRHIIEELAGGALPGRTIKVFWPGGSSAKVLPGSMLDTSTDLDGLKALGTMGGSGGIIVMDDSHCVVKAAARLLRFYAHESCGKCTPCRVGSNWAVRTYERILANEGSGIELALLDRVQQGLQGGRCLCGLGDAAGWVIQSTMVHFRNEYEEHCLHQTCSVEKALVHA